MSNEGYVEIGFLNVVATPHPRGVYLDLLQAAANHPVGFWGDQAAAITPPKQVPDEPDLHIGKLVLWTEINPNEPAINKNRLTETSLEALDFKVPDNVGFNGRVFYYMMNEKTHILTLELRNEWGKTVSPGRALRIFSGLFSPDVLGVDAPSVEITVIPEEDALPRVLGLPRLDRIEILVKRPNADDITDKTNAIMAELDAQNAKRMELILTREAGEDNLELNEKNKTYAAVGAENGYVIARGRNAENEPESRSTKEYPKVVRHLIDVGASVTATLREYAKRVRAPHQSG